jgi:galactokinase
MGRVVTSASAPGRVNLIGEHTDYNEGFVLPVALPLRVTVDLRIRDDREIRATTDAAALRGWEAHVIGPARVLGLDRGYDVHVASDIPIGAGLGSSGALGVAVLRALRGALDLNIDDVTLAQLAQRAENEFVGARSGIMDQLVASVGREGEALLIDCRSLAHERILLPGELELVVVDSGIRHEHAAGAYNERRAECEEAAVLLGVTALRDVTDVAATNDLPDPLRRRARHVVSEDARVLEALAALADRDLARLGALLDASHRSLRDDYEVSTPEVDLLVDLVREQEGVYGARITGGGFGGSIVALADAGAGHRAAARAVAEYEQHTGRDASVILPALEPDEVALG